MIERKRKGIDLCSWYLHLAAWRRSWEIVCQRRDSGRQGESDIRSRMGQGKLRSYLLPPGAVGGRYGSGCFHCLRSSSVWSKRIYPREKEERVSESCFQESDGVVVTGLTESRGGGWACGDGERELTLCCLGSRTLLLASKRERMYKAWPRQR